LGIPTTSPGKSWRAVDDGAVRLALDRKPASGTPCAAVDGVRRFAVGLKRVELVLALLHDAPSCLRHDIPDALKITERLRNDQPGLMRHFLEHWIVGVLLAQRLDERRIVE
jgi:hypothetical protein